MCFEPQAVKDHFVKITELSHPSGKENPVREYVIGCAKENQVEVAFYEPDATAPGKRVIVLRRHGSGEHACKAPVILQAHMDMVCYPNESIFPLKVFKYKDEQGVKWIKAGKNPESIEYPDKGTTLGADDGIGVATALAILEDESLKDYPIECLFTVQEETNMGGAEKFCKNLLTGRKYINLDAEDERTIIYGSAGGCETEYKGTICLREPCGYAVRTVSISGLSGGHSGIEINVGRLNAIKVLTEALIRLNGRITNLEHVTGCGIHSYDFLLFSISRDEEVKANSIPSKAKATIALRKKDVENFEKDFNAFCEALKKQYQPVEKNFKWNVCPGSIGTLSMNKKSTDDLLCILQQIPHGVIKMIPVSPNLVETSTNLYAVNVNGDKVTIQSSNRSSCDESLANLCNEQKNIGERFNFEVPPVTDKYPAWQPNESSGLLAKARKVYKKVYEGDFEATVIHAGLECGWVVNKYGKEMDCISIGPKIVDPHTGGERLQVSTVAEFYKAVSNLLHNLFAEE